MILVLVVLAFVVAVVAAAAASGFDRGISYNQQFKILIKAKSVAESPSHTHGRCPRAGGLRKRFPHIID